MKEQEFRKLMEIVKACDFKKVLNYEFEPISYLEKEFTAYFQISEDYFIQINEDETYVGNDNTDKIFRLSEANQKKWNALATEIFEEKYEDEIEERRRENAYESYLDYQDALGEYDRHGY